MKKAISILMAALLCVSVFAACGETESSSSESSTSTSTSTSSSETSSEASEESSEAESSEESTEGGAASGPITVVSREDGSGTRGAFVELIGVEDEEGNDMTTVDAEISNSTEVVIQSVAGNTGAIGYISLGSLDDTVKGVKIDGVEPTRRRTSRTAATPCPVPSTWPPRAS